MNDQAIAAVIKDILNIKTGWRTSEFWVTLVPALVAVLHVVGVDIGSNQTTTLLVVVWGAVSAVYIAVRTWLKTVHVGHAANLASLLTSVETPSANVPFATPAPDVNVALSEVANFPHTTST